MVTKRMDERINKWRWYSQYMCIHETTTIFWRFPSVTALQFNFSREIVLLKSHCAANRKQSRNENKARLERKKHSWVQWPNKETYGYQLWSFLLFVVCGECSWEEEIEQKCKQTKFVCNQLSCYPIQFRFHHRAVFAQRQNPLEDQLSS